MASSSKPSPVRAKVDSSTLTAGVPIDEMEVREDRAKFEELCAALRIELRPESPIDDLLVQLLAADIWRLRRVLAGEAAQVFQRVVEQIRAACDGRRRFEQLREIDPDSVELRRIAEKPHDDGQVDFGPEVAREQVMAQVEAVIRLERLSMDQVPHEAACVNWAAQHRRVAGHRGKSVEQRAEAYLMSLPPNLRGAVRNRALAVERSRLRDMQLAHYRQRVRRLSLVENAVPTDRICKRERELRRGILEILRELRERRRLLDGAS